MAVVQNPFLSTNARGSLSGLTASMTRGGISMRRKSKPSKHRKGRTPTNRSILGWIARQWGTVSEGDRYLWEAWAIDHPGTDRFGDPFIMSGINAFMMLNHKAVRLYTVSGYSETPPVGEPASAVDIVTVITGVTNPGDIDISWTELGIGLAADKWEVWLAGPFQSQGRTNVLNRYRYNGDVDGNVLLATLAGLAEGFWYWLQVRYVGANGQVTAWVSGQGTPKLT